MSTPAIRIEDVHVSYGEVVALDGATLDVPWGQVTGLVGMNGSGKSTLFRTVLGQLAPLHGSVQVDGGTPRAARASGMVAYVAQDAGVDHDFPVSVAEVVMMGRYAHLGITRRPRAADREAVRVALDRVQLTELADRPIGALSGGQRQRAFLARAIAQEARILLLDEPFTGVDKRSEALITAVVRELASDGAAVLVSTHDLHMLPELADEVALLLRRILFTGPTAEALRPERLSRAFGLEEAP
ncbi:metal ABC transporter ATP-binding protein [Salinibacterium sp. ZJ70]|uniref:metal ABC transporter ATP-binding protein n=1 Tax=Salinibacterium sp. ZJ70 TaxID=2708084 RepID=UPI001421EF87|nr:metal ABC transporter ATP-binding protein [Salinibacterium sp. ZJ70]